MSAKGRIVKLEDRLRPNSPPGCNWTDTGRCTLHRVVRVRPGERADEVETPAPCPRCGRPVFERFYVLIPDHGPPPLPPEAGD